ncbi:MAG: type II toxin-antitoxin system VapC family toxin [Deltaproteobacteria bacterium]|nr:type II toxin-antitoxin system VapC family toxin [Deltaproteobacteria bacterium]
MKAVFVDANVFLRFFTTDDKGQHEKAAVLLRRASAGKVALVTGPPVLFEIVWTLRSSYGVTREEVLDVLSRMCGMKGLRMTDADLVEEAVSICRNSGQEFADAYIVVSAGRAGAQGIATFNRKHFEKMDAPLYPL